VEDQLYLMNSVCIKIATLYLLRWVMGMVFDYLAEMVGWVDEGSVHYLMFAAVRGVLAFIILAASGAFFAVNYFYHFGQ
jgi:hypothetical protein